MTESYLPEFHAAQDAVSTEIKDLMCALQSGHKLRILSDINGTLNAVRMMGAPRNDDLYILLVRAKLAGHDVGIFSNDPTGNETMFKLLNMPGGYIEGICRQAGAIDQNTIDMIKSELFFLKGGQIEIPDKRERVCDPIFSGGVDFVFEDECPAWSGAQVVLNPTHSSTQSFLKQVAASNANSTPDLSIKLTAEM